MKVISGIDQLKSPLDRSVLTIGNYDGVHRAHRRLIDRARELAGQSDAPVVVLTFEPHPLTVVAPKRAPQRLSTPGEKLRLLEQAGVDTTVVARSEPRLLSLAPKTFVHDILLKHLRPVHIVEGPSFGFGKERAGTPEILRQLCAPFGCEVHIVDPVEITVDDERVLVSSSLIRRSLLDGRVERAAAALGRRYTLMGEVIAGDRRGRKIGFPTANIAPADQLIPADGVYAGRAVVGDRPFAAGISIGTQPTFDGQRRCVEAYLLSFDGDLYGKAVRLEFAALLRQQQKFDSPDALADQIRRDVENVRRVLATNTPAHPDGGRNP